MPLTSLLSSFESDQSSYSEQYQKLSTILEDIKKIQEKESPDLDKVVMLLEQATQVYKACSKRLKVIEETMKLEPEE